MTPELRSDSVRQKVLSQRRRLQPQQVQELSEKVIAHFIRLVEAHGGFSGRKIALYRALPSELDVRSLESWLKDRGNQLYFPRIADRPSKHLEFAAVPTEALPNLSWQEGPYGIQEPHSSLPPVDPASLEIVFVPGVAFGMSGERIGMGAGYYDRFLAKAPDALRVALAYDFQLFDQLEQNPWDQRVHWVVSELRQSQLRMDLK